MSQITNLSKIESNLIDSCSELQTSYDQEIFTNYLEPQGHDIFDTRRFTLHHKSSNNIKTATPKAGRNSSPARLIRNFSARATSAKLISKCLYHTPGSIANSSGKLVKRVENLEKKQELWKERAIVWDKERKSYQKTLTNVNTN